MLAPRPTLLLLLSLLTAARRAGAADPPAVRQVEEIEVTAHYENGVGTSDSASAGTITRKLVEDRPILRPGEVLELVPGLVITQHSGAGKANQYFLRGFNLDHGTDFATTLDGVPLNLRTHGHGQGYTDLNFLIPELIERVEYFKGPYFAAKGDFASAGAADLHYADTLPALLGEVAGGEFGYLRTLTAGSPELAGGRLLFGMEYMHDDGPWDRPDDYRRLNGVLRYSHELGRGRWNLTAMGYRGKWNATDQIPLRAVKDGTLSLYGTVDPTTGGDTYRLALSSGWQGPTGGGALEANLYAVRYQLHLFSNFTYFLDDPVRGDQFEQVDDRWLLGTSGAWTRELASGAVGHTLKAGWEGRLDRIDPVQLHHTEAREILETIRSDQVTEASGGLFLELQSRWTPWLRTVGGLRYDQYRFDVSSDTPANSGVRSAGRASPKASLVLGPWGRTELFASAGLGFHSNDARGTTMTVDPVDKVTPVSSVTPLVQTRGAELGLRTEPIPGVQTSLALWGLTMGSELLFIGDAGTTEASRPSRRYGVEWSTRWTPLRWLLFDLDVSLSRARFTAPDPDPTVKGDHIPGSIESAVAAGATLRDLGPLSTSLFMRYFGPRPLVEDGSVRSSPSTILNAQASWRLSRHVRLTADVFNLLDEQDDDIAYDYESQLRGEAAPQAGLHVHPAVRRTFRGGVAVSF